jgi:hypothetical protein
LAVDVFFIRTPEDLGLCANPKYEHVVVLLFDGSDFAQQGHHVVPLDVVTGRFLKDLEQGVSMMATEVPRP